MFTNDYLNKYSAETKGVFKCAFAKWQGSLKVKIKRASVQTPSTSFKKYEKIKLDQVSEKK